MARDNMGFDFGLDDPNVCFKRKHRWLFIIEGISADGSSSGVDSLPPSKSARPNISFKEIEAQHLNETIYFPGKPEWKPVSLTLYESRNGKNPVFNWLKNIYDPNQGKYSASIISNVKDEIKFKKPTARLELYDGCGGVIEKWVYEAIWPQSVEFGDLDMATSDLVVCELTLRYDRAYIE